MVAKVLVIGATNGRFVEALAKVTALHAKNNFSLSLLLGDLFSDPSKTTSEETDNIKRLLHGEIRVSLPTYFGLGQFSLPVPVREKIGASGEVCENLFFLGKKTVLNTSDGIRIVALGGRLDAGLTGGGGNADDGALPFHVEKDARSLKGAKYADLLITYEWPGGVESGSALTSPPVKGTGVISELAAALRPRYHFAAGGETFWEREPYRNRIRGDESDTKITRFLGVADWGNEKKAKSLYAFSINPKDASSTVAATATACPYKWDSGVSRKRGRQDSGGGASFFWGDHTGDAHERGDRGAKRGRGGRGPREARPPPGPGSCFFCLSYPQLEKHLIVSIGNEAYMTTAKGPLTNPSSNPPTLPFSSHILIVPLTHTPTITAMDESSRKSAVEEMTDYRLAIEKMLDTRDCGAVTFEVSRANGVHAHWQLVPVAKDKLAAVEEAFRAEARADRVGEFENMDADTQVEGDFFRVWVSGMDGSLVVPLRDGEYFDLQFGRKVLAKVLGLKSVHWKDCAQTFDEEVRDANDFKEAFKAYDFSL